MVVENTDVTASVYVPLTLATITSAESKRYDRRVSRPESGWPLRRIVVLPLVLFVVVSATVFTLAKLHLAKSKASTAPVALGDAARGQAIFKQTCGGCHGM